MFCCLQKMPEYEIVEFAKTQLTLPDKIDPGDEMSWQHYLYSKLGSKKDNLVDGAKPQQIDEVVDRIVAMAKVLFGLHMVSLYYKIQILFKLAPLHMFVFYSLEFQRTHNERYRNSSR